MLKEKFISLSVGAVMLLTVVPSKAVAQTLAQAKAVEGGHTLGSAPDRPRTDLKAVFAKEVARAKARASATNFQQTEKDQQDQTTQQKPKSKWTKGEKIGLIVFIGVMVAFTTAVLIRGINTETSCFEDPFAPNCVE